jgi:hypothetical protein
MPTPIAPNGIVGRRTARLADVKRLRAVLTDLQAAYDGWDALTAAARNAALKLTLRAVMALVRYQIEEIADRSRGNAV